jgi:hypothetical protein
MSSRSSSARLGATRSTRSSGPSFAGSAVDCAAGAVGCASSEIAGFRKSDCGSASSRALRPMPVTLWNSDGARALLLPAFAIAAALNGSADADDQAWDCLFGITAGGATNGSSAGRAITGLIVAWAGAWTAAWTTTGMASATTSSADMP